MAEVKRLSALKVSRLVKGQAVGLHNDGNGLYLQITGKNASSWLFRYKINGRKTPRDMGLGSAHAIGLAEARERTAEMRSLLARGIDPIEARRTEKARVKSDAAGMVTFKEHAEEYINDRQSTWKNAKHAAQWHMTLSRYIYPMIGDMPVRDVDVDAVLSVIKPLWHEKTETASRIRGRIEMVLNSAAVSELRSHNNPAQWRGVLENRLPSKSDVREVTHHKALEYGDISDFMVALQGQVVISARALEFLILTCTRTGEVIGAQWPEIDMKKAIWRIPAIRMKGKKGKGNNHDVPLSLPAVKLLRSLPGKKKEGFVFPGGKKGKPLSNNALLALLKRMKRTDITPHGFRSTYRNWAADETSYPREVCEMVLAHSVGDEAELAYKRTDLFKKRNKLMTEWAEFCTGDNN